MDKFIEDRFIESGILNLSPETYTLSIRHRVRPVRRHGWWAQRHTPRTQPPPGQPFRRLRSTKAKAYDSHLPPSISCFHRAASAYLHHITTVQTRLRLKQRTQAAQSPQRMPRPCPFSSISLRSPPPSIATEKAPGRSIPRTRYTRISLLSNLSAASAS